MELMKEKSQTEMQQLVKVNFFAKTADAVHLTPGINPSFTAGSFGSSCCCCGAAGRHLAVSASLQSRSYVHILTMR